jgi:hypothetical protein
MGESRRSLSVGSKKVKQAQHFAPYDEAQDKRMNHQGNERDGHDFLWPELCYKMLNFAELFVKTEGSKHGRIRQQQVGMASEENLR